MRACWWVVVALSACRFNPTIEDTSLVGCADDTECPRGAACVGGICVSSPLTIASFTAEPASVEAGDSCAFHVEVIHSLGPNRLQIRWSQTLGPRVPLAINGNRAELTTGPSYVGSYELEATVSNGQDPPQSARAACVALRTGSDAAWAVRGRSGDCSRDDPCGSLSEARDTGATYLYLGVEEGTSDTVSFGQVLDETFDDREIHGGFIYPGWRRDLSRARTTLRDPSNSAWIYCDRCVVSGISHFRVGENPWGDHYGIYASGEEITLREVHVELAGGGGSSHTRGIYAHADRSGIDIEGATVIVAPSGVAGATVAGIHHSGDQATIRDVVVDLRGAACAEHYGVLISTDDWRDARPRLDRILIHTGDANDRAVGLALDCVAARVWNSMAITDSFSDSDALVLDGGANCPDGTVIHSSLFVAGAGQESTAVRVVNELPSTSVINTILDAGGGFDRRVFTMDDNSLDSSTKSYDLAGSVMILEGGMQGRDAWGTYAGSTETLAGLGSLFGCEGCLATADTAAFVDRTGDFHLTADSSCCIDSGEPLGESDPNVDYEGVPRPQPPERPAVGPYELVR